MPIYSIDDLRSAAQRAGVTGSDEFLLRDYAERIGQPLPDVASQLGYEPARSNSLTGRRLSASVDNYQAGLLGVAEEASRGLNLNRTADFFQRRRQDNETEAEISSARARELGGIDRFADVNGPGDFLNYAGGLAAQSAPYLLESALGGVGARIAATGARAGLATARAGGTAAEVAAAEARLGRIGTAGGVAASYPSAVGDILQNQREQSGTTDGGTAALLGVGYAGLNALGLDGALSRGSLFRNGVRALDDIKGIKGGLARGGATAVGTGFTEGVAETGQEGFNQLGRMAVDPNETFFNERSNERFAESFVGGATLGGLIGGVSGTRRSSAYKPPLSDTEPTDLLNGFNPGTSRGFEDLQRAPAPPQVGPLGDLSPEWGTSQGFEDLQRPPALDAAGLYTPVGDNPLVPNGTGLTPSSAFSTDTQIPGLPFTPDVAAVDSMGNAAGSEADNALINDPGAALARQQQLAAQERVQKVRSEAQARAAELQGLRQRATDLGLKGNKYIDVYGQLERALDAGLINDAEMAENLALLMDRRAGSVEKFLVGKAATTKAAAEGAAAAKTEAVAKLQQPNGPTPTPPAAGVPAPAPASPVAPVAPAAAPAASPAPAVPKPVAPVSSEPAAPGPTADAGTVAAPVTDPYEAIPDVPVRISAGKDAKGKDLYMEVKEPRKKVRQFDAKVAQYRALLACLRS